MSLPPSSEASHPTRELTADLGPIAATVPSVAALAAPAAPVVPELRDLNARRLTSLTPGATAVLHQVCDTRCHEVLRALGLAGGAPFRVCRQGDPCIIQVRSTRIGLSRSVADGVLVTEHHGVPV